MKTHQLSLMRLLRAGVASRNAAPPCYFCTVSAGESVAQILQSEFGSFPVDLHIPSSEKRKQVRQRMPEKLISKPLMKSPQLEAHHACAQPHGMGLEFEYQNDNPHAHGLEKKHELQNPLPHGPECRPGHDTPHALGLEAKNGHDNSLPSGLDSKQVLHHTPSNGFSVAEQQGPFTKSSQDIIKLLIDSVNSQSWVALQKDVQTFRIVITPKEVAWVLKVLKNPSRAWELFKAASCWHGYAHDSTCYSIMVDLLGQNSDHSLLNDLLTEMEKRKIHLSLATINKLIGIYATIDEIHKAENYFLKLDQLGIQPTAFTYKCMLQAFAKAGKCEKALEIYRVMQKEQQPVTVISYNILMDALSRSGQAKSALNIFEEMKGCGHLADVYTYTILARTYSQAGMVGKALDLLAEMECNGVEPNKHTYNTILATLAGSHDGIEDAIKLFKRMSLDGICPDALSCQSILKVFCKGGQVGRCLELAQCINDKAAKKEVCENFIKALGKMGHLREMCELFRSLKADNVGPSRAISLTMINALCRGEEANEALSIMKEVEDKSGPLPLTSYNTILAALRNANQFQAAYGLFKHIKERGPSPDVVSYNIIIAGLTKMKKLPLAESLFDEMIRLGCMPSVVTFNSLLHSFARLGDVSSTRKLLQMMHTKEVTPDIISYNCAIDCFRRAGKPKVALKIFKEMKDKGYSPSYHTYNNILLALANAGMTHEGLSLFEQMKEHGCVPDAMTYTVLGRLYDSDPQLDKKQLVEEIQKAGLANALIV